MPTHGSSTRTSTPPPSRARSPRRDADDARPGGARARGRAPRAREHAGRIRLEGPRHAGGSLLAPLGRSRLVHDRRRARPAPCSAWSSASAPTRRCTRAPSTSISASSTSCARSTASTRTAVVEPAAGGLVHAGQEGHADRDRGAAPRHARVAGVDLHFGRVSVTEQVIAYQRKAIRDGSTLAVVPLILPEVTFETEAVWFSPERRPARGSRGDAEAPRRAARGRARADLAPARSGRCATAGTSAASRRTCTSRPGCRPSSSTTATPAASGSPSVGSTASPAGSRTRRACSPAARARAAAPHASRARSAAT